MDYELIAKNSDDTYTSYKLVSLSGYGGLTYFLNKYEVEMSDMGVFTLVNYRKDKSYKSIKQNIRQLAIDWQTALQDCGGLSYGEFSAWADFFRKLGSRYGLIREFRENGIC